MYNDCTRINFDYKDSNGSPISGINPTLSFENNSWLLNDLDKVFIENDKSVTITYPDVAGYSKPSADTLYTDGITKNLSPVYVIDEIGTFQVTPQVYNLNDIPYSGYRDSAELEYLGTYSASFVGFRITRILGVGSIKISGSASGTYSPSDYSHSARVLTDNVNAFNDLSISSNSSVSGEVTFNTFNDRIRCSSCCLVWGGAIPNTVISNNGWTTTLVAVSLVACTFTINSIGSVSFSQLEILSGTTKTL